MVLAQPTRGVPQILAVPPPPSMPFLAKVALKLPQVGAGAVVFWLKGKDNARVLIGDKHAVSTNTRDSTHPVYNLVMQDTSRKTGAFLSECQRIPLRDLLGGGIFDMPETGSKQ